METCANEENMPRQWVIGTRSRDGDGNSPDARRAEPVDHYPVPAGRNLGAAGHMQLWLAGHSPVLLHTHVEGTEAFVDGCVPICRHRELFCRDHDGAILRDHLGARARYGIDPRSAR